MWTAVGRYWNGSMMVAKRQYELALLYSTLFHGRWSSGIPLLSRPRFWPILVEARIVLLEE
jgi:hypothetical protein